MNPASSILKNVQVGVPSTVAPRAAAAADSARSPEEGSEEGSSWDLSIFRGRLTEVSGGASTAALTLAFALVREAQNAGEPVAWITERASSFFPPDVAETGVDLRALVVIRLPGSPGPARRATNRTARSAAGIARSAALAPRAADQLVRSGGFGLVVLDLTSGVAHGSSARSGGQMPMSIQSRLAGLAKKHRAALLFLTDKSHDSTSLGPLISFRIEALRAERMEADRFEGVSSKVGRFCCEARILKNKHGGEALGWNSHAAWKREVCLGPDGLC